MEFKFYAIQTVAILISVTCTILAVIYYLRKKISGKYVALSVTVSVLLFLVIVDMHLIEPHWVKIERIAINNVLLADTLKGMTVVQISDIHLKDFSVHEKHLVEKINNLKPDIIFITGDLFANKKGPEANYEFEAILHFVRSLRSSFGIFGVMGNYDAFLIRSPERLKELTLSGLDMIMLDYRKVKLPNNRTFYLVGSDYQPNAQNTHHYLQETLSEIPEGVPVILLDHYPDVFSKAVESKIDLVLAGHTHGGQIGIPFLINHSSSANKSAYMSGLFTRGKTSMYVNRGIGTTSIPVRLFCRPEITVFEFRENPIH